MILEIKKELIMDIPNVSPCIRFKSDTAKILEDIYFQYQPYTYWSNVQCDKIKNKRQINIDVTKINGELFNVVVDGIIREINEIYLADFIMHTIHGVLIPDDGFAFLHGAALSKNGNAFLLLGETQAGKSTMSAYLTLSDYKYITDDKIIFKLSDFKLNMYNRPLHLRDGGLEVLKRIFGDKIPVKQHRYSKDLRWLLNVEQEVEDSDKYIKVIFILNRNENSENKITELSTQEAFDLIFKNSYCSANVVKNAIATANFNSRLKTYRLDYSEAEKAEGIISNLLEGYI